MIFMPRETVNIKEYKTELGRLQHRGCCSSVAVKIAAASRKLET